MKNTTVFFMCLLIHATVNSMNSSQDWAKRILETEEINPKFDKKAYNRFKQLMSIIAGSLKQTSLLNFKYSIAGEAFKHAVPFEIPIMHQCLNSEIKTNLMSQNNNQLRLIDRDAIDLVVDLKDPKDELMAVSFKNGNGAYLFNVATKQYFDFNVDERFFVAGFALNKPGTEIAIIRCEPDSEQKIVDVYQLQKK